MSMPPGLDRILAHAIALESERVRRESTAVTPAEAVPPAIGPVPAGKPRPELSIVVPVWNPRPEHFRRCLASIAAAHLEGITHEILISDDASNDPTAVPATLASFSLRDPRFVRQERNLGGFGNFNWCLNEAQGDWVHLLHQDDWVEPDFYTELLRGPAQTSGASLRFCRTQLSFEDAKETHLMFDEAPTAGILADFLHRQTTSQRVQIAGAILNRDALSTLGGYDPRLGAGGDWEFWIRWGACHSVFYSPRPLATYSLHSGSWSTRDTTGTKRAESLALHRAVLIRSLRHLQEDLRHHAATGFYRTLTGRLLSYVRENNRTGNSPANRPLLAALLPATIAHGLGADLERLIGLVR